jgi:hypothetical protein
MAELNPLRRRMIEDMKVRNLSPVTQRCYVHAVAKFARYFNRSPDRLGLTDVRTYQTDIPQIPGLLSAIFRLIEARRNEIRSQLPPFEAKSSGCPPRSAGTRCFAFIKAHLCRRRLPHLTHLPVMPVPAAPAAGRSTPGFPETSALAPRPRPFGRLRSGRG